MADRQGRLKDEPEKIQAELFPFRFQVSDIDSLLHGLCGGDDPFIIRYEVKGEKFISIKSFLDHQRPHPKEIQSSIPPCRNKFVPRREQDTTKNTPNPPIPSLSSLSSDVPLPCVTPAGVPYPLPDPKTEPKKCLVLSYKSRKGVEYDNRSWDKANFGRAMAAATNLIGLCGDLASAESCLNDISTEYDAKGLSWTLETVARNAADWLTKNGRTNANTSRAGLRRAIAERKSTSGDHEGLVQITAGAIPNTIRDRAPTQDGDQKDRDDGAGGLNA